MLGLKDQPEWFAGFLVVVGFVCFLVFILFCFVLQISLDIGNIKLSCEFQLPKPIR